MKSAMSVKSNKVVDTFKYLLIKKPVPIFVNVVAKFAAARLKIAEERAVAIEDYVELAFRWGFFPLHLSDFFTIRPFQLREELVELLALVAGLHAKVMLEIGTALGGTLYLFTKAADSDAVIMTIDLPRGPFGGGYPMWKLPLYKSFAKGQQRIDLIRGDSHSSVSFEQVKMILGGKKLDFLFIDGDHKYEGVRRDYEMYGPLTREGGLIAFHDIVPQALESECEVSKFWNEVRHSYKHTEIVKDWNQKRGGIGVLFVE